MHEVAEGALKQTYMKCTVNDENRGSRAIFGKVKSFSRHKNLKESIRPLSYLDTTDCERGHIAKVSKVSQDSLNSAEPDLHTFPHPPSSY